MVAQLGFEPYDWRPIPFSNREWTSQPSAWLWRGGVSGH